MEKTWWTSKCGDAIRIAETQKDEKGKLVWIVHPGAACLLVGSTDDLADLHSRPCLFLLQAGAATQLLLNYRTDLKDEKAKAGFCSQAEGACLVPSCDSL